MSSKICLLNGKIPADLNPEMIFADENAALYTLPTISGIFENRSLCPGCSAIHFANIALSLIFNDEKTVKSRGCKWFVVCGGKVSNVIPFSLQYKTVSRELCDS
uniref:Uncharacterized protein n=1 Tax=Cacopsylla melanoneura TaxID=428564 RepID=A0A8D8Z8E6_9HEMI